MDESLTYDYEPTYHQMTSLELSRSANMDTPNHGECQNNTNTPVNIEEVLKNLQACSQNELIDGVLNPRMSQLTNDHLQQLLVLHRNFPLTVFIGLLKRAYAECDIKMDSVRVELFDLVKQKDGCPYANHDLKKRIKTRNAEQLTERLCRDIHTLLAILDGEVYMYTDLKEMVSNRKSSRVSSVSSGCRENIQNSNKPSVHASELKLLQESMSQLKADILSMKQSTCAIELERSEQIKTLKDTVVGLKHDLSELEGSVRNSLSEMVLCVQRVECDRVSGVVSLKNEVKALREHVKTIENGLEFAVKHVNSKLESLTKTNHKRGKVTANSSKRRTLSGPLVGNASEQSGFQSNSAFASFPEECDISCEESTDIVVNPPTRNDSYQISPEQNKSTIVNKSVVGNNTNINLSESTSSTQNVKQNINLNSTNRATAVCTTDVSVGLSNGLNTAAHDGDGNSAVVSMKSGSINVDVDRSSAPSNCGSSETTVNQKGGSNAILAKSHALNQPVSVMVSSLCGNNSITMVSSHSQGNIAPVDGKSCSKGYSSGLPRGNTGNLIPNTCKTTRTACPSIGVDTPHLYSEVVSNPGEIPTASRSHASVIDPQKSNPDGNRSSGRSNKQHGTNSRNESTAYGSSHGPTNARSSGVANDLAQDDDVEYDDFCLCIKRRTKTFYVGGFTSSLTDKRFSGFMSKRGLQVRKLFVIRNYKRDTACVKLVVEDNDEATWLENPFNWPRGIICRPWVPRRGSAPNNSHNAGAFSAENQRLHVKQKHGTFLYNRSDIDDYNPYLYLDDDPEY